MGSCGCSGNCDPAPAQPVVVCFDPPYNSRTCCCSSAGRAPTHMRRCTHTLFPSSLPRSHFAQLLVSATDLGPCTPIRLLSTPSNVLCLSFLLAALAAATCRHPMHHSSCGSHCRSSIALWRELPWRLALCPLRNHLAHAALRGQPAADLG